MLVTLIVDASFYREHRVGGWALWAISSHGTYKIAGRFRNRIDDNNMAELAAIANAIHMIVRHPVTKGATKLLVQSDSLCAIGVLTGSQPSKASYRRVAEHVHDMLTAFKLEMELRHVKGHSGIGEPRKYCHAWCDRASRVHAKAALTLARSKRKRKKKKAPKTT